MYHVVCPFTPQLSLLLINRPRRDGTLSWRWYTAAVGGTHDRLGQCKLEEFWRTKIDAEYCPCCWFTVVVTTLRPSTWPGTSTGSPTTTLDDVCDRQQHSSSRSLGRETPHCRRSGLSSRRSSCVECAACIGRLCSVTDCLQESCKDASVSAAVLYA